MGIKQEGVTRISKKAFYMNGGFSNPDQYRKQRKGGGWEYYRICRY